jgi:hypothetical protein
LGFNGDLYPTAGASSVMTTKGDIVRYNTERERYGIGSSGQVLQVASGLPAWTTINLADSVLTTQGDVLYEGASALARLGQSTNNFTLATKGAGANPAWQASSTSTLSGTGDVLYSSGANTLARLAIGSSNDVLTVAGGVPTWSAPSGGGALTFVDGETLSADASEINLSFTAISVDDISKAVIVYDGEPTATATLQMEINGLAGTTYSDMGFVQTGTSHTFDNDTGVASINLCQSQSAGVFQSVVSEITMPPTTIPTTAARRMGYFIRSGTSDYQALWRQGVIRSDQSTFSQVRVFPSSGNLQEGSRLTVYRVDDS